MGNFPANDALEFPATPGDLTNQDVSDIFEDLITGVKELPGALEQTELAIVAGSITVNRASHSVDTQSDAASDDLTNIAVGAGDVRVLILRQQNAARVVTLKHAAGGIGEIILDGEADYVMNKLSKTIILERIGSQWWEVTRTGWDDAEDGGQQLFTASGNFTVPMGITRVYVTMVGGGGGGGGGAGATGISPSSSTDGADGSDGGVSSFGGYFAVAAGKGGGKGLGLGRGGAAFTGGGHGGNKVGDLGGIGGVAAPTILAGWGKGGAGAAGSGGTSGTGGGGGASGSCSTVPSVRQRQGSLTPGGTVAVTVGAGGAGGAGGTGAGGNGAAGSTGASGAVLVEW